MESIKEKTADEIIKNMAKYIRKVDKIRKWCNIEYCDYKNSNCSEGCIINYFKSKLGDD